MDSTTNGATTEQETTARIVLLSKDLPDYLLYLIYNILLM
jgi:hypothetical protein